MSGSGLPGVSWPLLTPELPGAGGAPVELEDFEVEEIPAYAPAGEGDHTFALIEKRALTTPQAIAAIARALGLSPLGAGYAGMKDKAGVTRQWISIERARPEALLALDLPGLRVLEARPHRHKLRTGHLRGNRFAILLRGAHAEGLARAERILARLVAEGLPNYYGAQRFGRDGDNAERGLRLLRGESKPPRDRIARRMLVSSLQSLLFNELLGRRLEPGGPGLRTLLGGEVLQRTDSGGIFVSEETEVDAARLARGELAVTGPICGPRMPLPHPGSPALRLEQEVFAAHGVTPESFAVLGRLARGGRRACSVPVEGVSVEAAPELPGSIRLRFALPSGAYATTLLREVCKASPAASDGFDPSGALDPPESDDDQRS
jgi:tRNA pseudouridine13 synthase